MHSTATPTIVPTARIPKKLKSGYRTEPLLPVVALLIVVITGITRPIPRASSAVPINPSKNMIGIRILDCRG